MPEMSAEQQQALQEKLKSMSPEELREFQKQQCIFCQIVAGQVPAKKVYEDEQSLAIMDINPAVPGHILLLPKEHYAIMPQVPEKEIGHLFLVSKYLSQVLLKVLKAGGTNVFVANGLAAGQKAQHFIVHVIPRKEGDGVLNWEEKLLDNNIRLKVQQVVEGRLNELLGVKKEVVRAEMKKAAVPEKEKGKEQGKEEPLSGKEEKAEEEKEGGEREKEEDEAEPEEPGKEEQPQEAAEKGKSKKPEKKREEKEEGISLDDIAKLFT